MWRRSKRHRTSRATGSQQRNRLAFSCDNPQKFRGQIIFGPDNLGQGVRAPIRRPRTRRIFPPAGVARRIARGGQHNADANEIVDGGTGAIYRGARWSRAIALGSPLICLCSSAVSRGLVARCAHQRSILRADARERTAKPLPDTTNRLISKRHASLVAVLLPQLLPKRPEFTRRRVDYLRRRLRHGRNA